MTPELETIVLSAGQGNELQKVELIQELWSNYGRLERVFLDTGTVIVKHIQWPNEQQHPRGWNSDLSHRRKMKSYQVEKQFYEKFPASAKSTLPRLLGCGELGDSQYLILEDLFAERYVPCESLTWSQIKRCLRWLAHFHGHFMSTAAQGLWEVGSYWHLATRPEELEAMDDAELKALAPKLDHKLNAARFKTLVHGDAKAANFLFNDEGAAAVDFQYVGGGVGIKDVAYFLSSVYHDDELYRYEEQCLETYFSALKPLVKGDVESEYRQLYPVAWCDFYRFLQGWSPQHWKVNSYMDTMRARAIPCL